MAGMISSGWFCEGYAGLREWKGHWCSIACSMDGRRSKYGKVEEGCSEGIWQVVFTSSDNDMVIFMMTPDLALVLLHDTSSYLHLV